MTPNSRSDAWQDVCSFQTPFLAGQNHTKLRKPMHFSSEIQLSLFGKLFPRPLTLWPGVHGLQQIDGDVPTLWDRG